MISAEVSLPAEARHKLFSLYENTPTLTAESLQGNWGTLLLPINEDDSIDFESLSVQIETLIGFGVDGIYTNGTAGEFYNQSEEEFDRVSGMLADACRAANVPFQIGVSHSSPIASRARLRRAVQLGPSAVQLILPDWSPTNITESIQFLRVMADEAAGIPLVLYNPPHAKRRLTPDDFAAIQQAVPALIGIKVFGGDARWFGDMKRLVPNLSIFVPGHLLADQFRLGANGSYSNVACLHPLGAQRWYEQMGSDLDAAVEVGKRIQAFMTEHIVPFIDAGYSNPALDKLLACIGDWSPLTPRLRWPYQSIDAAEAARLAPIARAMLPEMFPVKSGADEFSVSQGVRSI